MVGPEPFMGSDSLECKATLQYLQPFLYICLQQCLHVQAIMARPVLPSWGFEGTERGVLRLLQASRSRRGTCPCSWR